MCCRTLYVAVLLLLAALSFALSSYKIVLSSHSAVWYKTEVNAKTARKNTPLLALLHILSFDKIVSGTNEALSLFLDVLTF